MSDPAQKTAFRDLLFLHNGLSGPKLTVGEHHGHRCHLHGTQPPGGCDQSLPSPELFSFLEPYSYTLDEYVLYDKNRYDYLDAARDFSYVMGRGVCSQHAAQHISLAERMSFHSKAETDCSFLYDAVQAHRTEVFRVMKHSLQPPTGLGRPEEVIADFGVDGVTKILRGSVGRSGNLLEEEHPRVLYCADSLGMELCSSLRRVVTSDGIDLSFNGGPTDDFSVRDAGAGDELFDAVKGFVEAPIEL